jgi:hypothetical protein
VIKLAGPKGLGDTIYVRAVALHFLDRGDGVKVFTRWPDVFWDLPVKFLPPDELNKHPNTRHVAYTHLIPHEGSQFQARCEAAEIYEPVKLELRWRAANADLLESVRQRAGGRKIFIYQPLKVCKTAEMEIMRPHYGAYRQIIADHSDCYRIKIGHPPFVDDDRHLPCELDLLGKGFIRDTFDVCTMGDLFFGECCFVPVIAEALDKNFICMFSRRAASGARAWTVTPQWQFHKKNLGTCIYDE